MLSGSSGTRPGSGSQAPRRIARGNSGYGLRQAQTQFDGENNLLLAEGALQRADLELAAQHGRLVIGQHTLNDISLEFSARTVRASAAVTNELRFV